jgi:hypothetical protein
VGCGGDDGCDDGFDDALKRTPATARRLTGPQEARHWHFSKMTVPGESDLPSSDGNVSPILVRRASKCPTTIRPRLAPASVTKLS